MLQFLSKVLGQDSALSILEKFTLYDDIPHALLFSGQQGIGKFYTALQFSKEINSKFLTNQSLKNKFNNLEEPYIKYIFPINSPKLKSLLLEPNVKFSKDDKIIWDAFQIEMQKKIDNPYFNLSITPNSSIRIEQIRNINKYLSLNFPEIPFRVIIIEHADLMTEQAQNSLLKNLEEPPPGFIFVLISTNPERLLPTIRSRCQVVKFEPLSTNHLDKILNEYFKIQSIEKDTLKLASGSISNTLQLVDFDLSEMKELALNILRYSLMGKFQKSLEYFIEASSDHRKLMLISSLILLWFSDCQKLKNNVTKDIYFIDYTTNLMNFISKYPLANYSAVEDKISTINLLMDKNINLTLILLDIIFEIRQMSNI
ncbi:MAG: hypothetical protein CO129_03355 [Ignavibacteriales bacterium CG_4_9_14_3_um_filter_34_10]|nr:MAG: hypothetical protein CO129_03355 [Ignavibacteriales bacterium CG_4_9_14_3_um_filter_34_10]